MARDLETRVRKRGVIITREYRRVRGQVRQSDYSAAKGGVVGLASSQRGICRHWASGS